MTITRLLNTYIAALNVRAQTNAAASGTKMDHVGVSVVAIRARNVTDSNHVLLPHGASPHPQKQVRSDYGLRTGTF